MELTDTDSRTADRGAAYTDADRAACRENGTDACVGDTRRGVLGRTSRLLIYSAPVIQLFRTPSALAGSGLSPVS